MALPSDVHTQAEIAALVAGYEAAIGELRGRHAVLAARVAELERRLGLNSDNSSLPPSADGLTKKPPRVRALRERSGKKSGGQKGHPGKTLRQTETPDITIDHFPPACGGCGAALSEAMATGHSVRQVFDLPEPQPLIVTEHRAHQCACAACGKRTRAAFPNGVSGPVQYGPRLVALVLYLLHYQLLPEKRLAALLADLFGVSIVTATIAGMSRKCAAKFSDFAASLRKQVAAAPVKHLDETGVRVKGKLHWLHVASTRLMTVYRVCTGRGSVPEGMGGVVVHDHWKSYYRLKGVLHALCNAHHLRELTALVEIEDEAWARKMRCLLRRACHASNRARTRGVGLKPSLIAQIGRCYDAIVTEGLALHEGLPPLVRKTTSGGKRGRKPQRIGHNLLVRLSTKRSDVLRFLSDPAVPFTNNQAEQDVRMMKVQQKISGCFRSENGAQDFATIRSVLSTARKQGWNMLQTLMGKPDQLAAILQVR